MTPKERLKRLESYSVCDNYREKEEDFREIEKALEIYEILKKHVYFSVKSRCIRMGDIYKRTTSFDYEDLKEWLRNAKWLFKRCIDWITKHLCRTEIEQRQKND